MIFYTTVSFEESHGALPRTLRSSSQSDAGNKRRTSISRRVSIYPRYTGFADPRADLSADSSVLERSRKKFSFVRPRVSVDDVLTTF